MITTITIHTKSMTIQQIIDEIEKMVWPIEVTSSIHFDNMRHPDTDAPPSSDEVQDEKPIVKEVE